MMRSYQAARRLFSFLESCSWCTVTAGVLVVGIALFSDGLSREWGIVFSAMVLGGGVLVALFGLFGVAQAQLGRAGVDAAEYSQQMLQVARDQLEVSRQALHGGRDTHATFATTAGGKTDTAKATASFEKPKVDEPPRAEKQDVYKYKGRSISRDGKAYLFDGQSFETREAVEAHVDSLIAPKLPGVSKPETA